LLTKPNYYMNTSFIEILKSNNWKEELTQSFSEKAGKGADLYFSYNNKKGNTLTFSIFTNDKNIRFRVYDPNTKEVSWLQIGMDASIDKVISAIVEKQDEITQPDTFMFYFSISGLGEVAILAWEQYEDNYR
jgi:hypothetical protein